MRILIAVALLSVVGTGWWLTQPEPAPDFDAALARATDTGAGADLGPAATPADPAVAEPTVDDDLAQLVELQRIVDRPALEAVRGRLAKALAEDQDDGALNQALCVTERLLGDAEAAVAFGDRAVALMPESSAAHLDQSKALAELMRVAGLFSAMKHLGTYKALINRAIELDPGNVKARVARIGFLVFAPGIAGGDLEEARRLTDELQPISARYYGLMSALALAQEGHFDDAMSMCEATLVDFPGDQSLHLSLARMLEEQDRDEEAVGHYDVVLEGPRTEKYYQALYHRAVLRMEAERELELASAALQEYAAADPYGDFLPGVAEALTNQGQVCELLGDTDRARACYEAALVEDPEFEPAEDALTLLE